MEKIVVGMKAEQEFVVDEKYTVSTSAAVAARAGDAQPDRLYGACGELMAQPAGRLFEREPADVRIWLPPRR
jgi:hypothetical protein